MLILMYFYRVLIDRNSERQCRMPNGRTNSRNIPIKILTKLIKWMSVLDLLLYCSGTQWPTRLWRSMSLVRNYSSPNAFNAFLWKFYVIFQVDNFQVQNLDVDFFEVIFFLLSEKKVSFVSEVEKVQNFF